MVYAIYLRFAACGVANALRPEALYPDSFLALSIASACVGKTSLALSESGLLTA